MLFESLDCPDRPLRFLFIDFNSYFAAVEQHDDPAIRGRPVIVTPLASEHAGAIAASYEAKALGIKRGTTVYEARAICPDVVVRVARHDRYVALHNLLMAEIEHHLPIARVYSIDECACRLSLSEYHPEMAIAKAREIKHALAERISPYLGSSIGIAPSILLAKLAAELKKPDGLTVIEAHQLPDALTGLPLAAIPGVGPGTARRLGRAGVRDFASLWQLPPKHARAIWGSVVGERFCYALHGHDIPDDPPRDKAMIGHSRVLTSHHQRPEEARIVARALLLKAASRLRLYGLHARRMNLSLRIRHTGFSHYESSFPASQNSWMFLRELNGLWERAMTALHHSPAYRGRIALVSIHLHGLDAHAAEPDLFAPAYQAQEDQREAMLWSNIDTLNRRYHRQMITLASHQGLDLNYLGVKIAFSRVPDEAEFHC